MFAIIQKPDRNRSEYLYKCLTTFYLLSNVIKELTQQSSVASGLFNHPYLNECICTIQSMHRPGLPPVPEPLPLLLQHTPNEPNALFVQYKYHELNDPNRRVNSQQYPINPRHSLIRQFKIMQHLRCNIRNSHTQIDTDCENYEIQQAGGPGFDHYSKINEYAHPTAQGKQSYVPNQKVIGKCVLDVSLEL